MPEFLCIHRVHTAQHQGLTLLTLLCRHYPQNSQHGMPQVHQLITVGHFTAVQEHHLIVAHHHVPRVWITVQQCLPVRDIVYETLQNVPFLLCVQLVQHAQLLAVALLHAVEHTFGKFLLMQFPQCHTHLLGQFRDTIRILLHQVAHRTRVHGFKDYPRTSSSTVHLFIADSRRNPQHESLLRQEQFPVYHLLRHIRIEHLHHLLRAYLVQHATASHTHYIHPLQGHLPQRLTHPHQLVEPTGFKHIVHLWREVHHLHFLFSFSQGKQYSQATRTYVVHVLPVQHYPIVLDKLHHLAQLIAHRYSYGSIQPFRKFHGQNTIVNRTVHHSCIS